MFSLTDSKQKYDELNKLIEDLEGHRNSLNQTIRGNTQILLSKQKLVQKSENTENEKIKASIDNLEKTMFLIGLVKFLGKSYQTGQKDDQTYYQKRKPFFFNAKASEDRKTQAALDEILKLTVNNGDLTNKIRELHSRIEKGEENKLKDLTNFYRRNYYIFRALYVLSVILMLSSLAIVFSSVGWAFATLVIGGVGGYVFNRQASYYTGTYKQLKVAADPTQKLVDIDKIREHAQVSNENEQGAKEIFNSLNPSTMQI